MYGLKQTPRSWCREFVVVVKGLVLTFKQCHKRSFCLHSVLPGLEDFVCVYVDDIIIRFQSFEGFIQENTSKIFAFYGIF